METLRGGLARIKELIHNEWVLQQGPPPYGVVVSMEIVEDDPTKVNLVYTGGKKLINHGVETLVFHNAFVLTHEVQEQSVQIGDFVNIQRKLLLDHITRIGTPQEIQERWEVDVTALVGWKPKEHLPT